MSNWRPDLNKELYIYLDKNKSVVKVKAIKQKDDSILCQMTNESDYQYWDKHEKHYSDELKQAGYDSHKYYLLLNQGNIWDYNYDIVKNRVRELDESLNESPNELPNESPRRSPRESPNRSSKPSSKTSSKTSFMINDFPEKGQHGIINSYSKNTVTNSITKDQIRYTQDRNNIYWLAQINDELFKEDEIDEKIAELQEKKYEAVQKGLRTSFSFAYDNDFKKITYCAEVPVSDSNLNIQEKKHCIEIRTTKSQRTMELYKSLITPNLNRVTPPIRKGKDVIIVNDLNTTKNTLINSQNIENNEAIKVTTWINDNLIRYRKSGDSSSDFKSLLPEIVHFIARGYIHIARAGIDIDDNVRNEDLPLMSFFKKDGRDVVDDPYDTGYDYENLETHENIGLGWKHREEHGIISDDPDPPYEFTQLKDIIGKPIKSGSLAEKLIGLRSLTETKENVKKREEIEVLLGLEYFIALHPEPEYSIFILKRLIVAWYADPELLISIRKIKYLVNHYRARSDVNINKNVLPTHPMIVIYLRYGARFFGMALAKINYYFTNYVYLGWDKNQPDYYIRHNNLIYYANGSTDVKKYLDKFDNSSEYYKKYTPNPRGELRYGQMPITYVPSDDYNERIETHRLQNTV